MELPIANSHSSSSHRDYAEIVVVRHGETAWNFDGRIQELGRWVLWLTDYLRNPRSHNPNKKIPTGGESLVQLYDRCTSGLQRIGKKHKGKRVVVIHGGVIRSLYKRAFPNGESAVKILNTLVNIFVLYDGDKLTLKTWGDVSHVKQTGFLQSGFGGDRTST